MGNVFSSAPAAPAPPACSCPGTDMAMKLTGFGAAAAFLLGWLMTTLEKGTKSKDKKKDLKIASQFFYGFSLMLLVGMVMIWRNKKAHANLAVATGAMPVQQPAMIQQGGVTYQAVS